MQQETDYILREVQRLTNFITSLVGTISICNSNDIETQIKETDDFIRKEFNLSFKDVLTLDNAELIQKLKELPIIHLEHLATLFYEISVKLNSEIQSQKKQKKELSKKVLFLLNEIEKNTKVYSLRRAQIRETLKNMECS